jgi:hypothetical protein
MKPLFLLFSSITLLAAEPSFVYQKDQSKLLTPDVREASGLAVSPSSDDFLWVINDSNGTPEIHLSGTDGTPRGSVKIKGVKNKDWEDLAPFTYQGKPYLLVADTGDNDAKRSEVRLLIVREPKLPTVGKSITGEIEAEWIIDFTYENGSADCEAVSVDAQAGKIILVTKRTTPPGVYELPLRPKNKTSQIAKKVGTTQVIAPGLSFIAHRNQPTGMDFSPDGKMAAIITYYGVFVFPRTAKETWAEAFAKQPERIGAHGLQQAESVAFSKDGHTIFCVSEGINSSVVRFVKTED